MILNYFTPNFEHKSDIPDTKNKKLNPKLKSNMN